VVGWLAQRLLSGAACCGPACLLQWLSAVLGAPRYVLLLLLLLCMLLLLLMGRSPRQ
jgi:hypothetical protein